MARLLRYAAVGIFQNAVNVATFATLDFVGVSYLAAALAAGAVALAVSFVLNRSWTFSAAAEQRVGIQLSRYVVVFVSAVGLGLVLLAAQVELLGMPPVLGQAIAIAVVAPISFLAQRGWVFGDRQPGSGIGRRA